MSTAYCVKLILKPSVSEVLRGADYISHEEMGILVVQRSQAELQLAGCRKDLNAQSIPISSKNKRAANTGRKKKCLKKMIILLQAPHPLCLLLKLMMSDRLLFFFFLQ